MTEKSNKRKITVTLDSDVVSMLDDFATIFGETRSGALNGVLLLAQPNLIKVAEEYKRFVSEIDKAVPVTEDQLDLFAGRTFRRIFGE